MFCVSKTFTLMPFTIYHKQDFLDYISQKMTKLELHINLILLSGFLIGNWSHPWVDLMGCPRGKHFIMSTEFDENLSQ